MLNQHQQNTTGFNWIHWYTYMYSHHKLLALISDFECVPSMLTGSTPCASLSVTDQAWWPGQAVYRETLIFWTVSADQLDGGEMSGQDMNSSPWVYQTSFTVHKTLEMKGRGHDLTSYCCSNLAISCTCSKIIFDEILELRTKYCSHKSRHVQEYYLCGDKVIGIFNFLSSSEVIVSFTVNLPNNMFQTGLTFNKFCDWPLAFVSG